MGNTRSTSTYNRRGGQSNFGPRGLQENGRRQFNQAPRQEYKPPANRAPRGAYNAYSRRQPVSDAVKEKARQQSKKTLAEVQQLLKVALLEQCNVDAMYDPSRYRLTCLIANENNEDATTVALIDSGANGDCLSWEGAKALKIDHLLRKTHSTAEGLGGNVTVMGEITASVFVGDVLYHQTFQHFLT